MLHHLVVHAPFEVVYAALRRTGVVSVELTGPDRGVLHLQDAAGLMHQLDEGVGIDLFEFDTSSQVAEILVLFLAAEALRVDHEVPRTTPSQ